MKHIHHTWGYSIIASIMMIGFLLILTTSTLNLVLQEMQDGSGRQHYLKAFAGAEGWLELALLKIKQEWFGYDEDNFSGSLLGDRNLDADIAYDFDSKEQSYSWTIDRYGTDIIPLFSIDAMWVMSHTSSIDLQFSWGGLSWNIIGNGVGLSWTWIFQGSNSFSSRWSGTFETISVEDFLLVNTGSYITLFNTSPWDVTYTLIWRGSEPHFSRPKSEIFSSSRIWKYSQNLRTVVDNSEFLGILKYSVYSWN